MADELERCRAMCGELHEQIQHVYNSGQNALANAARHTGFQHPELRLRCIRTLQGHYGKVFDLCWFKDPVPTDLLSVSQDGKILVWDTTTGNKKVAIPMRSAWIMTCTVSPSGRLVASGGLDNLCTLHLIDDARGWENHQAHRELQQHEGYLSRCRFIDDNRIITSSGDATCVLWDVDGRIPIQTFTDHTGDVMSISVKSGSDPVFVSGSVDATAKVFDARAGVKCVANFTGHESDINDVQWFPDENAFASGSDDSSCRMFDMRTRKQINHYADTKIYCGVTGLDFTKSGHYLVTSYDDAPYCMLWGAATAETMSEISHEQRVSNVMVSEPGNAIASASWDFNIRIWA